MMEGLAAGCVVKVLYLILRDSVTVPMNLLDIECFSRNLMLMLNLSSFV